MQLAGFICKHMFVSSALLCGLRLYHLPHTVSLPARLSTQQLTAQRQKQQIPLKAGLETDLCFLCFLLVKASHEASALGKESE